MIRFLITVCALIALEPVLASAQEPQSVAAPLAPFRIGTPALDTRCQSAEELEDSAWAAYARTVSERMERTVLICGASRAEAAGMLADGALDLALTTADAAADLAEAGALRPLFRVRGLAEPLRREIMIFAAPEAQPITTISDYQIAAFSPIEMQMISAGIRQLDLDDPAVMELAEADAERMLDGRDWLPGQSTRDPVEALNALADSTPSTRVAMTQGRYSAACDVDRARCGDVIMEWRGFPATSEAFAVSSSVSTETLYRLLGLHLFLASQQPDIVTLLSGREDAEFEPTEATAFRYQPSH